MPPQFDVVVVGAGIFGSCTAYHCQKLGLRTLLLEQFNLGHSNGSSHGKSRIIRYAHAAPEYVPLVADAYSQIEELEEKRGEKLWNKLGLLWTATGDQVHTISGHLKKHNIEHTVIPGNQISSHYPQLKFDEKWTGLIDPMGGVIYADKWLRAFQDEFQTLGGVIHENEPVNGHSENPDGSVTVSTVTQNYTSGKIIYTVGCWITKMFPNVNFEIEPTSLAVCYWNPKPGQEHLVDEKNFPVFIVKDTENQEQFLGLPDVDYPGKLKFLTDDGDALTTELGHPDKQSQELIDMPAKFIKEHIPVVDGEKPFTVERCKYTCSPDHHYVIGPISKDHPNILVGGCGSGSGFKVAPGIGRALAEMTAGREKTTVDVSFFSPRRFD